MAEIHGLVGRVTLFMAVLVTGWSLLIAVLGRPLPNVLLGAALWLVALLAVAGGLGIVTALVTAPPSDALHVVYGVLAVVVLPGAFAIARRREEERRSSLILVIAMAVLLILLLRLFQTGG